MAIVAQRTHSRRATCPETTLKQLLEGDYRRVISGCPRPRWTDSPDAGGARRPREPSEAPLLEKTARRVESGQSQRRNCMFVVSLKF